MTATRTAARTASRTARLLLLTLAAAIFSTIALAASPASASVTGSQHVLGCQQGRVFANTGMITTDQAEEVYWVPVLYAWTADGWVAADAAGWAKAGALHHRTSTWYDARTNDIVQFRPFSKPSGHYAVINLMWTASGGYTTSISYTNAGNYYCSI